MTRTRTMRNKASRTRLNMLNLEWTSSTPWTRSSTWGPLNCMTPNNSWPRTWKTTRRIRSSPLSVLLYWSSGVLPPMGLNSWSGSQGALKTVGTLNTSTSTCKAVSSWELSTIKIKIRTNIVIQDCASIIRITSFGGSMIIKRHSIPWHATIIWTSLRSSSTMKRPISFSRTKMKR